MIQAIGSILAGVRDGETVTWYLDVGGWFAARYIKAATNRIER